MTAKRTGPPPLEDRAANNNNNHSTAIVGQSLTGDYLLWWTDGYLTGADRDSYAAGYADGYWQRVAEENAEYPPPKVFTLGRWHDRNARVESA